MVIRLEQNYRCTKKILDAANEVIAHNASARARPCGPKTTTAPRCGVYRASDEGGEALFVATPFWRMSPPAPDSPTTPSSTA